MRRNSTVFRISHETTFTQYPKFVQVASLSSSQYAALSPDGNHMVTNDGIYVFNATSKSYTKVLSSYFKTSKTVWSTEKALLVFSWEKTNF